MPQAKIGNLSPSVGSNPPQADVFMVNEGGNIRFALATVPPRTVEPPAFAKLVSGGHVAFADGVTEGRIRKYLTGQGLLAPSLAVPNTVTEDEAAPKKGLDWDGIALKASIAVFVAFLLFVVAFGIIGGKSIPGISSLYGGSPEATATSTPATPTVDTTQPAPLRKQ